VGRGSPARTARISSAALTLSIAAGIASTGPTPSPSPPNVTVRLVADEAEAVLAILAKQKGNEAITDADWQRLFTSEGYLRLKKREASMQRSFGDDEFKTFVLLDETAGRAPVLQETLGRWQGADVGGAARRALAYLPRDASIKGRIYPVIKPRENSFVFEVDSDPAIFLYLDPAESAEQFENTLAHELHHIGYGSACPSKPASDEIAGAPENVQSVIKWIGAFGEGFAMLAAAGGPDLHPHAASKVEVRKRWDRDMQEFDADRRKLEKFFLDLLDARLTGEEIQTTAFSFYGVQGPWYTVGWKMAVTIEKAFGRPRLIECICDPRTLFETYNQAALKSKSSPGEPLTLWPGRLIRSVRPGRPRPGG